MNGQEMINAVYRAFRISTNDPQFSRAGVLAELQYTAEAYTKMAQWWPWLRVSTDIDVDAGTDIIDFDTPPINCVWVHPDGRRTVLTRISIESAEENLGETDGTPEFYAWSEGAIMIFPSPYEAGVLKVSSDGVETTLADSTGSRFKLPESLHQLILDATIHRVGLQRASPLTGEYLPLMAAPVQSAILRTRAHYIGRPTRRNLDTWEWGY